jgi:hypothetical protein
LIKKSAIKTATTTNTNVPKTAATALSGDEPLLFVLCDELLLDPELELELLSELPVSLPPDMVVLSFVFEPLVSEPFRVSEPPEVLTPPNDPELLLPPPELLGPPPEEVVPPPPDDGGELVPVLSGLLTTTGSLASAVTLPDAVASAVIVYVPLPTAVVFHAFEQLVVLAHVAIVAPLIDIVIFVILPDETLAVAETVAP